MLSYLKGRNIEIPQSSPLHHISKAQYAFVTGEAPRQNDRSPSVLAEFRMPQWKNFIDDSSTEQNILLAYGISDPRNLGMLVRTLSCLGWSGLGLIPTSSGRGCVDPFGYESIRASRGAALLQLPILPVSVDQILQMTKEPSCRLFLAEKHTNSAPPGNELRSNYRTTLLMVGSEATGLRDLDERLRRAGHCISIPTLGPVESLNVAVAAGILMDRLKRK